MFYRKLTPCGHHFCKLVCLEGCKPFSEQIHLGGRSNLGLLEAIAYGLDRVVGCCWPRDQTRSIGIAVFDEVRPIGVHDMGDVEVVGFPWGVSVVEIVEHVIDLRLVVSAARLARWCVIPKIGVDRLSRVAVPVPRPKPSPYLGTVGPL